MATDLGGFDEEFGEAVARDGEVVLHRDAVQEGEGLQRGVGNLHVDHCLDADGELAQAGAVLDDELLQMLNPKVRDGGGGAVDDLNIIRHLNAVEIKASRTVLDAERPHFLHVVAVKYE